MRILAAFDFFLVGTTRRPPRSTHTRLRLFITANYCRRIVTTARQNVLGFANRARKVQQYIFERVFTIDSPGSSHILIVVDGPTIVYIDLYVRDAAHAKNVRKS